MVKKFRESTVKINEYINQDIKNRPAEAQSIKRPILVEEVPKSENLRIHEINLTTQKEISWLHETIADLNKEVTQLKFDKMELLKFKAQVEADY